MYMYKIVHAKMHMYVGTVFLMFQPNGFHFIFTRVAQYSLPSRRRPEDFVANYMYSVLEKDLPLILRFEFSCKDEIFSLGGELNSEKFKQLTLEQVTMIPSANRR